MENQGFPQRGTSLAPSLRAHERNKAALLLSIFFMYLVGFVASPFRGVGVGFDEPHLRLMF